MGGDSMVETAFGVLELMRKPQRKGRGSEHVNLPPPQMKATKVSDAPQGASARGQTGPIWPLLVGIVLPTLITWVYFDLLASQDSRYQQLAAALGKGFQFALPVIAFWLRPRSKETWAPKYGGSAGAGLAFGIAVAAAMMAIYFFLLLPNGVMDGPRKQALEKVGEMGFDSPMALVGLGVFYSLFHSALEEYYWRWFIFRELDARVSLPLAATISGLGFMSHHVLVLARYFGWNSPLTWLFSLGIAIGGAIWALIYRRWGSLLGPWLGHLLVDAAIFAIGYHLLFVYTAR